uniref:cardiolipin synthase (CMP-forming) n=1 Tax=Lygus hesperus TaxID=30085 RepID=A0A146MFG6_LYGHE
MTSHLRGASLFANWPNRIPVDFFSWIMSDRRRTPLTIGLAHLQCFSDHLAARTKGIYSRCEEMPAYLRRRRSLKALMLKDRNKKYTNSQQILKRKRDLILERLSFQKSRGYSGEHIIEREYIWTVPNILCVGRIIVCPYLGYLIVQENYLISCYILAAAGITDFLDGFIARNFKGQSSKLGSFLDPLADKVLVATVFSTLTFNGVIPVALTSIIVARDVSLAAAGFYVRYQSLPPPKSLARYFDPSHATAQLAPTLISKVNTFVQLGTICCTLSAPVFGFLDHPFLIYMWWLTGATTVLSAASYVFSSNTYRILKEAKVKRES